MFSNILKWTFKVAIGELEKELNLHLDADTPIQAVEEVALQIIAHCAKVKEAALAAQQAMAPVVEHLEPIAEPAQVDPIDEPKQVPVGNEHA